MGKYNWRTREEVVVDKFGTRTVKTIVESYRLSEGSYGTLEPVSQRILPVGANVNDVARATI